MRTPSQTRPSHIFLTFYIFQVRTCLHMMAASAIHVWAANSGLSLWTMPIFSWMRWITSTANREQSRMWARQLRKVLISIPRPGGKVKPNSDVELKKLGRLVLRGERELTSNPLLPMFQEVMTRDTRRVCAAGCVTTPGLTLPIAVCDRLPLILCQALFFCTKSSNRRWRWWHAVYVSLCFCPQVFICIENLCGATFGSIHCRVARSPRTAHGARMSVRAWRVVSP